MRDWGQHLATLWAQHTLGHFYILVRPDWPQDLTPINAPTVVPFSFIADVLKITPAQLAHHPDFLFLRPQKDHYTIGDLENGGLFSFLELVSFARGHRFIVFAQADQLSEIILNKLLKTLENPPPHTTIFFLSQRDNFPATILSRAAVWRATNALHSLAETTLALGPELRKALQDFWAHQRSWSFLQETLRHHPERENALAQWILQKMSDVEDFAALNQLQQDWQAAEKAQAMHRPKAVAFYLLLTGLRQHLPQAPAELR